VDLSCPAKLEAKQTGALKIKKIKVRNRMRRNLAYFRASVNESWGIFGSHISCCQPLGFVFNFNQYEA